MFPQDKRKMLLSKKQELLQEIEFYDRKIALEGRKNEQTVYFEEDHDDSDSDPGFHLQSSLDHQTEAQLENQSCSLSICLQATQELTGLMIIQSEQEVLVKGPDLENGNIPSEEGDWMEVMAECRVDRVHFSMTFYMHQPRRKFSAPSFHGMRVKIVKSAHEKELEGSVLGQVKRPSDVVQLLKGYAAALRSRRNTLTKLNERFGDRITLELAPSGGFLLKCAGLVELTWTLECNKSILANFHHTVKCEVEFVEPRHLRLITASHLKLSDPSLTTTERTLLLADIISKCLEVAGIDESSAQETDADTTAQSAHILPEPICKDVMAPPAQLPRRAKSKRSFGTETSGGRNEDGRSGKEDRKRTRDKEGIVIGKDIAKENQKAVATTTIENKDKITHDEIPTKKQKGLKDNSNVAKNILAQGVNKENNPVNNVDKQKTQVKKVVNQPKKGQNDANLTKKQFTTDKNVNIKIVDIEKNKETKQKEVAKSTQDNIKSKSSDKAMMINDNKATGDEIKQNNDKQQTKPVNEQNNPGNKQKKSISNKKLNSIPTNQIQLKNVATVQNKPQIEKTKSVAVSKNTDPARKPVKNLLKTKEAKKKTQAGITDKNEQSKEAAIVSRIPKPVHTKIPVKIPNKNSKELTPKSKSSVLKPKLKHIQNKHNLKKSASEVIKAVKHQLVTSTPIRERLVKKKVVSGSDQH